MRQQLLEANVELHSLQLPAQAAEPLLPEALVLGRPVVHDPERRRLEPVDAPAALGPARDDAAAESTCRCCDTSAYESPVAATSPPTGCSPSRRMSSRTRRFRSAIAANGSGRPQGESRPEIIQPMS